MKEIIIQMPGFQQKIKVSEVPRKGEQVWIKNEKQPYVVDEVIHDYSGEKSSKAQILVNLFPKNRT